MQFIPCHDRIVLDPIDDPEEKVGGLYLPSSKSGPVRAKVVAVGPGAYQNGVAIPMSVKKGDVVLVNDWVGFKVNVQGGNVLIAKDSDILCKVE